MNNPSPHTDSLKNLNLVATLSSVLAGIYIQAADFLF